MSIQDMPSGKIVSFSFFLSLGGENPIHHLKFKRLSRTVARLLSIVADPVVGKKWVFVGWQPQVWGFVLFQNV